MNAQLVAYLVLGITLCATFAALGVHYFARARKESVERPKHRMLEDDD